MTIYRAAVLDTPGNLGDPLGLRAQEDGALVVRDGVIIARTDPASAVADYPDEEVVDLRGGVLVPGLVDTHVHFPQARAMGALGMSLLQWLEEYALPEEARLAESAYAAGIASEFVGALASSGTTTALVFGSHFPGAMDALFSAAAESGLRITSGLVMSDRMLREELLTTPERAVEAAEDLARRWHGQGRLRYAVTPRFSLSASEEMLEACGALLTWGDREAWGSGDRDGGQGLWFTSHLNENIDEIATVRDLFPGAEDYLATYTRHGLATPRSVFAHNVHPAPGELEVLSGTGSAVAHCPSSNSALGSGLFSMRSHVDAGVPVALGTDVGAGAGFCLLKEGLQAYFVQQLLGERGVSLAASDLLHLATRSGAQALGLADQVGDLSAGKEFDAVLIRPPQHGTLANALRHAKDPTDALAKIFTLGSPADIQTVWVGGEELRIGANDFGTRAVTSGRR